MFLRVWCFGALILCGGCSSFEWSRLAPPGFVKYEDIANEKEPNPEISEYVENRQEEEAGGFPKLSKAPSENDRPERKSDEEIKAEIESMAAARDALNEAVTADRAMADEDLTASDELTKASEKIQKALKRDD